MEVVLKPYLTRRVAVPRCQRLWAVELVQQTQQTPAIQIISDTATISDLPCQVVQCVPGNVILAFHQHLQLQDSHLQMHTSCDNVGIVLCLWGLWGKVIPYLHFFFLSGDQLTHTNSTLRARMSPQWLSELI